MKYDAGFVQSPSLPSFHPVSSGQLRRGRGWEIITFLFLEKGAVVAKNGANDFERKAAAVVKSRGKIYYDSLLTFFPNY